MSDRDEDLARPSWATVRALRERIDELEELLAQARSGGGTPLDAPPIEMVRKLAHRLKCSTRPARIVAMLWLSPDHYVHTEDLSISCGVESDNAVKQHVSRLRKTLGDDALYCVWGEGYGLTDKGRRAVANALNERVAA